MIDLLKKNRLDEAGRILFENNPLTTICSLICNHEKQCEGHCVLEKKGSPVHFSAIENYISDAYAPKMVKGPATSNGHRIAIVGSGPAGLTIAMILARCGYQVALFEGKDRIGGVLRSDSVIIAISQGPRNLIVSTTTGLEINKHGLLVVDELGNTGRPGVFASVDVVNGSRTVVEAVAHSKIVAETMHNYVQSIKQCEE